MFQRYPITKKASPDILNEKVIFGTSGRFAKNRLLKSAMSERLGSWMDGDLLKSGIPTQQYCNLYEKFGNGGFGTILTGNIMIDSDHLEGAGNVIIDENLDSHERREGFRKVAAAAKSDGSIFIGQLNHCGAQTLGILNKTPFSSSNTKVDTVKAGAEFGDPIPLTVDQIKHLVVDKFAYAARYLYDMGFDGCEIHGANGFLLAEFMSPKFNKRTDEYGGSKENRVRIVLEVFEAIRKLVPPETGFIVGIKMNSVEFQNDGLNVEDAIWMCQQFENVGFDFIELSGGNFENMGLDNTRHLSKNKREAYFYEFAKKIKPHVPITTVFLTGGFRTLQAMVQAIKDNTADGIGIGRPAAAEPDIAKKLLKLNIQSGTLNAIVDTRLQLMAAMTQLVQAGKIPLAKSHQEPCYGLLDTSNKQEIDKYIPEFLKFMKEKEAEMAQGKIVNVAYCHPIMF